jgi:hypothetical protein
MACHVGALLAAPSFADAGLDITRTGRGKQRPYFPFTHPYPIGSLRSTLGHFSIIFCKSWELAI